LEHDRCFIDGVRIVTETMEGRVQVVMVTPKEKGRQVKPAGPT